MTAMDKHELYDVVAYEIVDDYTLWLRFDDGHEQTINFEPILTARYLHHFATSNSSSKWY